MSRHQRTGRKSRYETHIRPRLESIRSWRRRGLTEQEISEKLGIARSTLSLHKTQQPRLVEALHTGKDDADAAVENKLFQRAMGYEYEETKHTATVKDGKEVGGRIERTTKQVAPDVTAQIFYLKNRAKDRWRDRYGHEHTGADGESLRPNVVVYLPQKEASDSEPTPDSSGGNGAGANRLQPSKKNGGNEDD